MISKDSFVKIMDSVQEYWDELDKLEKVLGVYFEESFLTNIVDNILDAISDDTEEGLVKDDNVGTWIYYYAFELDFGRVDYVDDAVEVDGVKYPLETAEQLYDFLVMLDKRENNSEKTTCGCEQIMWERDMAIKQLEEHGIPFGGKADNVVKVVRCKDCKWFMTFDEMQNNPYGLYTDRDEFIQAGIDLNADGRCHGVEAWVCLDDYCSFGEKK